MRTHVAGMVGAALALAGCGDRATTGNASAAADAAPAGPVKRQPGSWSSRIEITRLDAGPGIDTARMREGMQAMINAGSGLSVCVTPEAAAREAGAGIEQMGQTRNCKFDKKVQSGERLDFAGVCEDARGQKVRLALTGTSGATAQDLVMAMSPVDAGAGPGALKGMEMRVRSTRTGDCKPGDVTPPAPSAARPGA